MFDIIIIGGGPAGSEVAYRTGSSGYSVAVIESRNDYQGHFCCTGIVSLDCISTFAIPDRLVKRRFSSARFFSPSGSALRIARKNPIAALLERPAFDGFLAERAKNAGAEYRMGSRAESIEYLTDRARVQISTDNRFTAIETRAVVLATGTVSPLVRPFPDITAADLVLGAQAEVEAPGLEEVEVYCGREIAPEFFAWLVPAAPGRALAGLLSRKNAGKYMKGFLDFLSENGRIKTGAGAVNYRPIALKSPEKTYKDRLLAVGGAAGQVKPTTGGGIYFGLLAAGIAAGTLDEALRQDKLDAEDLAAYEKGWKNVLASELGSGSRARSVFEHLNDAEFNTLFGLAKTMGIEEYLSSVEDLSFDWHAGTISKIVKKYYNI